MIHGNKIFTHETKNIPIIAYQAIRRTTSHPDKKWKTGRDIGAGFKKFRISLIFQLFIVYRY
jgi:hypothetical protein